MSKTATIVLILLITATNLIITKSAYAQVGTQVNGILTSDTTWTKANSPYTFSGNVLVSNGTILTIEAGVIVNLNSYFIQVNGTLFARGSDADKIYINGLSGSKSYQINFTQSSSGWNEQLGSGCLIENSVLNVTSIFIENASPKINRNSIGGPNVFSGGSVPTVISMDGGSPVISNNTLAPSLAWSAIAIIRGSPIVSNNYIFNAYSSTSGITIDGDNNAYVYGNTIGTTSNRFQWGILISGGSPTIERNNVYNNAVGVGIGDWGADSPVKVILQNNTIEGNDVGIRFGKYDPSSIIRLNNIELGSSDWVNPKLVHLSNSLLPTTYIINAVDNWWGTNDASAVSQAINHELYQSSMYNINVSATLIPALTSPNPQAMPDPTNQPAAIPIPKPYPTSNPSPSPTQSFFSTPSLSPLISSYPSSAASPSPSSTETPAQIGVNGIEIATLIGIIVIIGLLISIIHLELKKLRQT
jgi:hypothetical protein